jgi:hypothetical protein
VLLVNTEKASSINVGVIEGEEDSRVTRFQMKCDSKRDGTFIAHQI